MRAEDQPVWLRFRRNLSLSLLGAALSLAIKLGQTALLTKLLQLEDYGRTLIVLNLFVFLESFIGLRVSDAIFRFFQPLKEQRDERALQGLLFICLGISLTAGLLICGGVWLLSPWAAERFYGQPELAHLFNIYGCTVLVSSFSGVYEPLLRIYDRFAAIVVPQVLGSLLTLIILAAYFATTAGYDLRIVVAAFAIGVFVQTIPPLTQALRLLRPSLADFKLRLAAQALAPYRAALVRCLFHSNLSGYLKLAISPGDIFILGLFSSPTQVALYGLARQLTAPLALLQINIQTAIMPEVTALVAKRSFAQLQRLVVSYMAAAAALSGVLLIGAVLLGRLLISWLARPEYLAALPVFYALLLVVSLMLIALVFHPLAVSLDLLWWYNLGLLLSAVILLLFIIAGRLDALTMAYAQVAGALLLRALCNIPVWRRLRALIISAAQNREPARS